MKEVLAVILAGGKGSRLEPLTRDRAKPAVPFGGVYRIVDFTLSNCLNSRMRRILVMTQYKAMSLDRHINLGWKPFFCRELGEFVDVVPPQQRIDESWYRGTADAVYQNIYAIERENPEYIVILAGDHIYKMNYHSMLDYHIRVGADVTIGALQVTVEEARHFGVMQVDEDHRVLDWQEKVANPMTVPGQPGVCLASMGIYVASARFLYDQLCRDANVTDSSHDFGHDVIPSIIDEHRVYAFPFQDENRKGQAYWRDVGTLDAYFDANMELVGVDPMLNLYDQQWPIRTYQPSAPPPKFVFGSRGNAERSGRALDSIVCAGCIVSGGLVERSVLGPHVRINSYAHVQDSILFDRVSVGRRARLRRVIVDKGVRIPEGVEIGIDPEADRRRGFTISPGGVVVLAKGDRVPEIEREMASR